MRAIESMTRIERLEAIATLRRERGVSAEDCYEFLLTRASPGDMGELLRWLRGEARMPKARSGVSGAEGKPEKAVAGILGGKKPIPMEV